MKRDVIETVPLVQDDGTKVYVHATPDLVTPPAIRENVEPGFNHGVPHRWTPDCHAEGCTPVPMHFSFLDFRFHPHAFTLTWPPILPPPPLSEAEQLRALRSLNGMLDQWDRTLRRGYGNQAEWDRHHKKPRDALDQARQVASVSGKRAATAAELVEPQELKPSKPYPPLTPRPKPLPLKVK